MVTALLLALPLGAGAAGLGKLTVLSVLGQTLRAEVDITASREELSSLSARVASAEAFKQAGIEYSSALTTIRLAIDKRADGRPFLSMVSDRPFNEPFLDMLIELSWNSGRLVREYTFLLDPPESLQRPPSPMAAPVASPTGAPAAAPESKPAVQAPAASQAEMRDAQQAQEKPAPARLENPAEVAPSPLRAEPVPLKAEKESAQRLVKRGDTLSQIAKETKPEGVNLDQMLVALFRGNQDAFEGNVNRLKAGKILAIPDRENASSVNADEAKKTVLAHSVDFSAYSKKLAASVAAAAAQKDEAPKRAVTGKIVPKVEDKVPATAPGKDKLEVSKSEAASGAAGKAGAGRLAAIEETLIAREKALKDANSRIAELEKNLNDLRKLIELKNQGMAELQKQAQVAKPTAPGKPAPEAEVNKPAASVDKPVAKAAEKTAEKAAEKSTDKPADKPVETAKAQAPPKPAPAEKKPATPPPPPAQPEPSFIDESPEIVYGGAGILALLLFYFGFKRYQQRKGAKSGRAGAREPGGASTTGGLSTRPADSDTLLSPTDFSNLSSASGGAGDAGVDPVAEADVYLAYGRDVQAEEILLDALKTDPTRHAIHLKLLEIYANRKSSKQFESIASDLHKQTGGSGPDWEKAAKMGQKIDPSNPLYGAVQAAAKVFDPDATLVISPQDHQLDLGSLELAGGGGEELLQSIEAGQPASVSPEVQQEEMPASLDFELDLAEPEPAPAAPAPVATVANVPEDSAGPVPVSGSGVMDIDLGLDAEVPKPTDLAFESVVAAQPSQSEAPADFDLDLDLGPTATAQATPSAPAPAAPSGDAAAGLDFNFDLDAGEPAVTTPAAEQASAGGSIDFDLDVPAPAAPQPVAASVDFSSINLDLGEPAEPAAPRGPAPQLDDAASQDVETKLELAQAYEEMGDKEGARELLQEVLSEGNAAQKEAARSKLDRLD
ncbi:MAG: pilus assembly protein [Rhodocyclaceae bacterium]|nr:MAG: pilus assembly protein [Rhodocyclaceae bacterium]